MCLVRKHQLYKKTSQDNFYTAVVIWTCAHLLACVPFLPPSCCQATIQVLS